MSPRLKDRPVLLITHLTASDTGEFSVILENKKIPYKILRLNKGDRLPEDLSMYSGAVSFGGIQSANDDYVDYIHYELKWLERAFLSNFPVFGICLGAQLIARALGASVTQHPEEIYEFGWYPIFPVNDNELEIPDSFVCYHRHGEIFSLPHGARLSASGPNCPNQGFIYSDNVIATQFHPEVNESLIHKWLLGARPLADEGLPGSQGVELQIKNSQVYIPSAHRWLSDQISSWLSENESI